MFLIFLLVETLKQQNLELDTKLNSSESSQCDKIEKNLIKSLLIGYVVSGNPNDKNQVLRMISSVLDFNAAETEKVGLNKQHSSWLGSLLGGGGASGGNVLCHIQLYFFRILLGKAFFYFHNHAHQTKKWLLC